MTKRCEGVVACCGMAAFQTCTGDAEPSRSFPEFTRIPNAIYWGQVDLGHCMKHSPALSQKLKQKLHFYLGFLLDRPAERGIIPVAESGRGWQLMVAKGRMGLAIPQTLHVLPALSILLPASGFKRNVSGEKDQGNWRKYLRSF